MGGARRNIVGLCGSLRAGSFNRGLLDAAAELLPAGVQLTIAELRGVPEFDEDEEARGSPARVHEIRADVERADIILFAVPEYNYSLPGWFKNVFDWLSRPTSASPLRHKPTGIVSASAGERGAARAQMALRQSLVFTDTYVMPRPELFVGKADSKYDGRGRLTDSGTLQELRAYLESLLAWARLFDSNRP